MKFQNTILFGLVMASTSHAAFATCAPHLLAPATRSWNVSAAHRDALDRYSGDEVLTRAVLDAIIARNLEPRARAPQMIFEASLEPGMARLARVIRDLERVVAVGKSRFLGASRRANLMLKVAQAHADFIFGDTDPDTLRQMSKIHQHFFRDEDRELELGDNGEFPENYDWHGHVERIHSFWRQAIVRPETAWALLRQLQRFEWQSRLVTSVRCRELVAYREQIRSQVGITK